MSLQFFWLYIYQDPEHSNSHCFLRSAPHGFTSPFSIPGRDQRQERMLSCLVTAVSSQPTQLWVYFLWLLSVARMPVHIDPDWLKNCTCRIRERSSLFGDWDYICISETRNLYKEWEIFVFIFIKMELNSLLFILLVLFHTIKILVIGYYWQLQCIFMTNCISMGVY